MKPSSSVIACLWSGALLACAETGTSEPGGDAGLHVEVAPLSLPWIGNAEYTIVVRNAVPQVVWSQTVTSDRFGDGVGSISYVGPCDADSDPHSVTLTLDKLWDSGSVLLASPKDYVNPGPITLTGIDCRENADVPVVFNLTIMRSAVQGFFDIAVDFKDIFCSAKVDCTPSLLHDAQGVRGPTVVMGFACTSGEGRTAPEPTWLYLSDVTFTCVDGDPNTPPALSTITRTIDVSPASAGQQDAVPPVLYNWAKYFGAEGFDDVQKCYWNHAFGLNVPALQGYACTLSATGTASDAPLPGGAIASDATWPVIRWQVEVLTNGALCGERPLDVLGSGVQTVYVTPGTTPRPAAFTARYACAEPSPTRVSYACEGSTNAAFGATMVGSSPAVEVTVAGKTSPAFLLPAGATLLESCCLDSCCQP